MAESDVRSEVVSQHLFSQGLITAAMASTAAARQKTTGERFTTALVLSGGIPGDELMRALLRRNGGGAMEVDGVGLQPRVVHLVPERVAFEYQTLPLHLVRNILFTAVPNPWSHQKDIAKLEGQVSLHLEPVPVEDTDVLGVLVKCHQMLRNRSVRERRLGQALVERGLLNQEQLRQGLLQQKQKGGRLGQALIDMGFISERQLFLLLSERLRIPLLDGTQFLEKLTPAVARKVTASFAEHNMLLPFAQGPDGVKVACTYSCDLNVLETIKSVTGARKVDLFLVDDATMRSTIRSVYSMPAPAASASVAPTAGGAAHLAATPHSASAAHSASSSVESSSKSVLVDGVDLTTEVEIKDVQEDDVTEFDTSSYSDPEVPKIINYVLYQAVKKSVSDIHIEQYTDRTDVKFRIDGQLRVMPNMPVNAENVLRVISKLKIDSKLDIAERRKPQDGAFRKKFGDKLLVDFRLAIQPTLFGENAVIRVLDRTAPLPSLPQLGMPEEMMKRYLRCIGSPQGMIVFTGPTGSGKTTTLYCTLEVLRKQNLKIITAEDPVEYQFDGIQQCQVQEQIGNTFAKYLRGFLRQDPDVILIGEIRDQDTAIMATRAAVTGHLIFTTIHATDSVGVIRRVVDMGVDGNMLSMSLLGVVYQRLLRRICSNCKTVSAEETALIKELQLEEVLKGAPVYRGAGCEMCDGQGYRGRIAVYEFWEPGDDVKDIITGEPDDRKIRELAIKGGLRPLMIDAIEKVRLGVTSLSELQEVVPYGEIVKAKNFLH